MECNVSFDDEVQNSQRRRIRQKPGRRSPEKRTSNNNIPSPRRIALPPNRLNSLDTTVLQRQRVFLNAQGRAEIGIEEILQYTESVPKLNILSPLHLEVHRSCGPSDEIPLMPCHGGGKKKVVSSSELWPEPIRSRNKNWVKEDLTSIIAGNSTKSIYKMSRVRPNGATFKNRLSMPKFRILQHNSNHMTTLMTRRALMISKTFAVVSVYTSGITGRVYSTTAAIENFDSSSRAILLDAFVTQHAKRFSMIITLKDLESLFSDRLEYLVPGRKKDLCSELPSMLSFKYDTSKEEDFPTSLKINKTHQVPRSFYRRQEYAAHQAWLLKEKQRKLKAFLALPKRMRYRHAIASVRIRGFTFTISIYRYPTQRRSFSVFAYHSKSCTRYQMTLGLTYVGELQHIPEKPTEWEEDSLNDIAEKVLPMIQLETEDDGWALRVGERLGNFGPVLALETLSTAETVKRQVLIHEAAAHKLDLQRGYENDLESLVKSLEEQRIRNEAKRQALLNNGEAIATSLAEKLKIIDTMNAGTWTPTPTDGEPLLDPSTKLGRQQTRALQREAKKALTTDAKNLKAQKKQSASDIKDLDEKWKKKCKRHTRKIQDLAINLEEDIRASEHDALHRNLTDLREGVTRYSINSTNGKVPKRQHWPNGVLMTQGLTRVDISKCRRPVVRYTLFHTIPNSSGEIPHPTAESVTYRLDFYHPSSCTKKSFSFTRKDIYPLLKQAHENEIQRIPNFVPMKKTSAVDPLDVTRAQVTTKYNQICIELSKATDFRTRKQKSAELLDAKSQLREAMAMDVWDKIAYTVTQLLHAPCTLPPITSLENCEWTLNREIYKGSFSATDQRDKRYYFQASVAQQSDDDTLHFTIYHPTSCTTRKLVHPDSFELINEFTFMPFIERHVQLTILLGTIIVDSKSPDSDFELKFGD